MIRFIVRTRNYTEGVRFSQISSTSCNLYDARNILHKINVTLFMCLLDFELLNLGDRNLGRF